MLSPNQLTGVVLVLAVLVVLNLLLTLALVRRLRADATGAGQPVSLLDGPAPGTAIPTGVLAEVGGPAVDVVGLATGRALIAFAASGCAPCHEQIPVLRSVMAARVAGGESAVVVVQALDDTADEFVQAFAGVAPVVVDQDSRIATDFGVEGYPLYVECEDGESRALHAVASRLRTPVRA